MIRILTLLSIGLLVDCIIIQSLSEVFLRDTALSVLNVLAKSVTMDREGLTLLAQLFSPSQLLDVLPETDYEWENKLSEAVQPYPELHSVFLSTEFLPSVTPTVDFVIWSFSGDEQILLASVQRHQHRSFTEGLHCADPWNAAKDAWRAIPLAYLSATFDNYLLSKLEESTEPLLFLRVWQRYVLNILWSRIPPAKRLLERIQAPEYTVFKQYLSRDIQPIAILQAVVEMTADIANATERSAWLVDTARAMRAELNESSQCQVMHFVISQCGTDMAPYPFKMLLTESNVNLNQCEELDRSLWEATFRKMVRLYPKDILPSEPLATRFIRWQRLAMLPEEDPLEFEEDIGMSFDDVCKFILDTDLTAFPTTFANPLTVTVRIVISTETDTETNTEIVTQKTDIKDSLALCEWFLATMKQKSVLKHFDPKYGRVIPTNNRMYVKAIYNAVIYIFTLTGRWDDAISEQIAALWFPNPPERQDIEKAYRGWGAKHTQRSISYLEKLASSELLCYFHNAQELLRCVQE